MRVIFLCNTPYQVMTACCVKHSFFKDSVADIIISDHMQLSQDLAAHVNDAKGLFENVFNVASKQLFETVGKANKYQRRFYRAFPEKIVDKLIKVKEKYDVFLCANVEPFSELFFLYLRKFSNYQIKAQWFEDGLAASYFDKYIYEQETKSFKHFVKHVLYGKTLNNFVEKAYVFAPDSIEWRKDIEICTIPKIDKSDAVFVNQLNLAFGYNSCEDVYDKKYIFFEDGFLDYGNPATKRVVQLLVDKLSADNMMVKIHPRNPQNFFGALGCKTNKNTFIPWEIIALNTDLNDKVLLTVCSGAVLSPYFHFGETPHSIMLYKIDKEFQNFDKNFFSFIENEFLEKNKAIFHIPSSVKELEKLINQVG